MKLREKKYYFKKISIRYLLKKDLFWENDWDFIYYCHEIRNWTKIIFFSPVFMPAVGSTIRSWLRNEGITDQMIDIINVIIRKERKTKVIQKKSFSKYCDRIEAKKGLYLRSIIFSSIYFFYISWMGLISVAF